MTRTERNDSGVATIFVVLAMTAVVVGAALAIDVGGYVAAARSAQNSADATVLAVATDCALTGAPIADYSPYRKTGQTITTPYCGDGETDIMVTKEVDGLLLAQSAGDVNRRAWAKWGTLVTANVIPLTISDCEFSQARLDGDSDIILYLDDPKPQSGCSSLPGGFSQLDRSGCETEISVGGTVTGVPGAGGLQFKVPCITNPAAPRLPKDVLIPMYDASACEAAGCKGKGPYPIIGFAMFKVTGYSFIGNNFGGTLGRNCPDANTRGRYCLRGDFIRFTTSQGTPGDSKDFGVTQVHLFIK